MELNHVSVSIFVFYRLELHLEKRAPALWAEVVRGDPRGQLVTDLDQLDQVHQQLAHLTSDTPVN